MCIRDSPYSAKPARSERLAVSRDRPHSTGVESAIHTSSLNMLVRVPSARISQLRVPTSLRSRLLYPDCPGRYGNKSWSWLRPNRSQRPSLVKPRRACATASVTSSASLIRGLMPTGGRHGTRSGLAFSRSSTCTYSAVTRVFRSASTRASCSTFGLATSILDTLALMSRHQHPSHPSHPSQLGISHLGQAGLLQRLVQEVVRRRVLHVGDLLALQAAHICDGTSLWHHHFLGQGVAFAHRDDVKRSGSTRLRREDRRDLAGARQVDRARAQRLQLQVTALEQAEFCFVRGVSKAGLFQQQLLRLPTRLPDPQGHPRSVDSVDRKGRRPGGRHCRHCGG